MSNNTTFTKQRTIKYLNKDFNGLKRDLTEHLKVHFPDSWKDFSETSTSMTLLELMAYTGDVMSFYLDKQFKESFIQTAKENKNILKHAKQLGFKTNVFGKAAASGKVDTFLKVPATTLNEKIEPNTNFAGVIKSGAKLLGGNGVIYETLSDINFANVNVNDPKFVAAAETDATTGQPTSFALKVEGVDIKAGETKTQTFTIGTYESFKTITIADSDVLEIISVVDSIGNKFYEVDFLAQDTIFDSVKNTDSDSVDVPNVIKLRSAPFRFITDFNIDTGKTSLIFGSGDALAFDGELIPNLGDLSLPLLGKENFSDFSIDPQNFLKTRTLGIAPVNTTLTVRYRVGGGADSNSGANEIRSVTESSFDVGRTDLNQTTVGEVGNSFSVINPDPIQGGRDEISIDEIKHLISANFASQSRLVTVEDFLTRALSMPAKFGSVFRVNARPGAINKSSVELIVLAKNSAGNVTTGTINLKENLKKYLSRFRMLTDSIDILDGEVINIGIDFSILVKQEFNKTEVLSNCILVLREYFEVDKWQISQPIILSQIFCLLSEVDGVLSIYDLNITNKTGSVDGRSYSSNIYNIQENTRNGIVFCKSNAIFEVKFENIDLKGSAK